MKNVLTVAMVSSLSCCGLFGDDDAGEEEDDNGGGGGGGGGGSDCDQDGVAATALDWALPGGFPEDTFPSIADTSSSQPDWGLADLDGDGAPDLVLTRWDTAGDDALGTTKWQVYVNAGDGFSSTATSWSIPAGYPELTFPSLYDASSSQPTWGLTDLDGDGLSDLVITRYDDGGISGLGTSKWLVYLNTGSGFSSSATNWAFPVGYPDLTFQAIADSSSSTPTWALTDLDGDDDPDLVVTRDDNGGIEGLGSTEWLVYENDGTRFSGSGVSWELPGGYPSQTFTSVADTSSSEPTWGLTDLDGDGLSDLVVTRYDTGGAEGLGSTTWLHYANTGSRFAADPTTWSLPVGFPDLTFASLADTSSGEPGWALADLDRDDLPDLIVTRYDTGGVSGLGSTLWQRYGNDGSSFSSAATTWSLPGGYPDLSFPAIADTSSSDPSWALTDLDGDGALDLVVTRFDVSGNADLGTSTWLVHPGACE